MGSGSGTTTLNGLSISGYFNDNNETTHFIIACATEEDEQETDSPQAAPSPEPVPASPEPVTYTGSGDDVIDIERLPINLSFKSQGTVLPDISP